MVVNKALLQLVQRSPLFNSDWYQHRYPDVARSGMDPAMHYLLLGSKLQRDPGPDFSCHRYLADHPHAQGQSAFLHFLTSSTTFCNDITIRYGSLCCEVKESNERKWISV